LSIKLFDKKNIYKISKINPQRESTIINYFFDYNITLKHNPKSNIISLEILETDIVLKTKDDNEEAEDIEDDENADEKKHVVDMTHSLLKRDLYLQSKLDSAFDLIETFKEKVHVIDRKDRIVLVISKGKVDYLQLNDIKNEIASIEVVSDYLVITDVTGQFYTLDEEQKLEQLPINPIQPRPDLIREPIGYAEKDDEEDSEEDAEEN